MPDSLKGLHEEAEMWSPSQLPTSPQLLVLEHLNLPGDPRLYISRGSRREILNKELTNSEGIAGKHVRCDIESFFHGAMSDGWKPWIELDHEKNPGRETSLKIYRITNAGREAIAQCRARDRYARENLELAKRILKECRRASRAPVFD
jgi:hypothetical protein